MGSPLQLTDFVQISMCFLYCLHRVLKDQRWSNNHVLCQGHRRPHDGEIQTDGEGMTETFVETYRVTGLTEKNLLFTSQPGLH
jgi:hypothetical protein